MGATTKRRKRLGRGGRLDDSGDHVEVVRLQRHRLGQQQPVALVAAERLGHRGQLFLPHCGFIRIVTVAIVALIVPDQCTPIRTALKHTEDSYVIKPQGAATYSETNLRHCKHIESITVSWDPYRKGENFQPDLQRVHVHHRQEQKAQMVQSMRQAPCTNTFIESSLHGTNKGSNTPGREHRAGHMHSRNEAGLLHLLKVHFERHRQGRKHTMSAAWRRTSTSTVKAPMVPHRPTPMS